MLHYVGGAYLLVLGVRAWRAGGSTASRAGLGRGTDTGSRMLRIGFVVELSNPKVALFFLAFLPQFVRRSDGAVWSQLLFLGVIFCLITTPRPPPRGAQRNVTDSGSDVRANAVRHRFWRTRPRHVR